MERKDECCSVRRSNSTETISNWTVRIRFSLDRWKPGTKSQSVRFDWLVECYGHPLWLTVSVNNHRNDWFKRKRRSLFTLLLLTVVHEQFWRVQRLLVIYDWKSYQFGLSFTFIDQFEGWMEMLTKKGWTLNYSKFQVFKVWNSDRLNCFFSIVEWRTGNVVSIQFQFQWISCRKSRQEPTRRFVYQWISVSNDSLECAANGIHSSKVEIGSWLEWKLTRNQRKHSSTSGWSWIETTFIPPSFELAVDLHEN